MPGAAISGNSRSFAHWARGKGIKRGQTVAILLPNRIDYVPAWYGLTKIGVVSALINNHLAGAPLMAPRAEHHEVAVDPAAL